MKWPKTRFRRSVEKFMHDLRARERGLETELHVAKQERDRAIEQAMPDVVRPVGEDRHSVRWEEPSWGRWSRLCFSRSFWQRKWEVQAFDAAGHMRWYGAITRGLPAILAAEAIVGGGALDVSGARCIRVRNVETGRTAWYGFVKKEG